MHNPSPVSSIRPRPAFSAFDRLVFGVLAAILVAIAATVAFGDRVGVLLVRVAPLPTARSTQPILVQFNEPMQPDSVRLRVEPEIAGTTTWNGQTIVLRPAAPLAAGTAYTVTVERGARSLDGRELLNAYQFTFTVAPPRIAYLYPADSTPQNIWMVDATDPTTAQQLTFSPTGIYDFGVSPDGTTIAFAERTPDGRVDIKLLTIDTGALEQITNCADAECTTPVWRPDGQTIAYNRVDFNTDMGGVGSSPTRIWTIDLNSQPATTRPLLSNLQILGFAPQWSADGERIAFFNRDEGILVFDLRDNSIQAIPSRSGTSGALSPDGSQIVYPEIVLAEGQEAQSYLNLADLEANTITRLTEEGEPVQDERVVWHPDGERLAVARRYYDERYTQSYQIYLMNADGTNVHPLTDEPRYAHAFFTFDATGDQLVVQRFPLTDEAGQPNVNGRPEVWTLDVDTGALTLIANNAFFPRWIP